MQLADGQDRMLLRWMVTLLIGTLCCIGATAGVPELLSYQGKLLDASELPVPDASYWMEFRFYGSCTGGELLLTDSQSVQTRDGIYAVLLGGGTLTPGLEEDILGVFQNHSAVCLGVKVGSDSEMVPRLPIASSGYAIRAAGADQAILAPAKVVNGVHICAADWNDDGSSGSSEDVVACIQSALAELTTAEDGTDNSRTVKLPEGHFDVSSACSSGSCFELKSGMHIVGEMPRLKYVHQVPPDLHMAPNGGTWLDPGPANTLFTGQHLRGVVLERFGVANFGKVAELGGDGEDGIAFSTIRDVYCVGTPRQANPRSTEAFVLYNIQHLRMDHVKVHGVERGLYIIGQNPHFQPANSVISDFYVYTYPDPQGGIRLETIQSTQAPAKMMNYVHFVRPQVNSFSSTQAPGSTGIWLKGYDPSWPVQLISIDAADVEGAFEVAIRLENAKHNRIEVAGVTGPAVGLSLDANSSYNTIASVHDRLSVSSAEGVNNVFIGHFDEVDDATARGLYYDRIRNRWLASLGKHGMLNSGSGYLWYDDVNKRWLMREGQPETTTDGHPLIGGTGSSAIRGPVIWTDEAVTCATACLEAGMESCVDGWQAGSSVGCAETIGRRLCACR